MRVVRHFRRTLGLAPCSTASDRTAACDQTFWCESSHCVTGLPMHDAQRDFLDLAMLGLSAAGQTSCRASGSSGSPDLYKRYKCHGRCEGKQLQWRAPSVPGFSFDCQPTAARAIHAHRSHANANQTVQLHRLVSVHSMTLAATLQPCSPMTPRKSSRMVPTQNCTGKA